MSYQAQKSMSGALITDSVADSNIRIYDLIIVAQKSMSGALIIV